MIDSSDQVIEFIRIIYCIFVRALRLFVLTFKVGMTDHLWECSFGFIGIFLILLSPALITSFEVQIVALDLSRQSFLRQCFILSWDSLLFIVVSLRLRIWSFSP